MTSQSICLYYIPDATPSIFSCATDLDRLKKISRNEYSNFVCHNTVKADAGSRMV